MSKKIKLSLLFLGLFALFAVTHTVLAQNFGTNQVGAGLNNSLGTTDPRILIGRIIQIVLSFLGVIALVLVMYAGFLWLTSNGEEDKVATAKKILTNSIIGLVIILASWGIATFILNQLAGATGVGGNDIGTTNNGSFSDQGVGAIGNCSVETFYPSDGQKDVPRNSSIMITFKEALKLDSVCSDGSGATCACNQTNCNKLNPGAIRIYKKDLGDACSKGTCLNPNSNVTDVIVNVTDSNKTLILSPATPLGSPSDNTEYSVRFSNQLKKVDGNSMFKTCGTDYFQYGFTVNTNLDLLPPEVLKNGIFPLPDNVADTRAQITGRQAVASLTFSGPKCPSVNVQSSLVSVTPPGPDISNIMGENITKYKLVIPADAPNTLQVFDGNTDAPLGSYPLSKDGIAMAGDYFSFQYANFKPGDMYTVVIDPGSHSDNIQVARGQYIFVAGGTDSKKATYGNFIGVPNNCDANELLRNIQAAVSGNTNVTVTRVGVSNTLNFTANKAGVSGNDFEIYFNNASDGTAGVFKTTNFAGGLDAKENYVAQDKQDRPMNSALQINFSESINPLHLVGSADDASSSIRIVNASATSSPDSTGCRVDADCQSYKCENKVCVGNYLGGNYKLSNQYKTLEFVTDRECGINACGEKIYCFPANSHLSVELIAANLKTCTSNNDCLSYGSFNTCSSTPLGYSTCQDSNKKNYPLARLDKLDGIVDAAINSFDGARDLTSDGPLSFYYENEQVAQNAGKKDNYKWSFYIGGKINLTPPQITFLNYPQGKTGVGLAEPIQIKFSTLMLNSTLHSGSSIITNGTKTVTHKSINLSSASPTPFGYWISSENQDVAPVDGEPDLTVVLLNHSPFSQSMTYKAQIGSGVKDIYQNCFKPSNDLTCGANPDKPSCCFGVATDKLSADGNCQ